MTNYCQKIGLQKKLKGGDEEMEEKYEYVAAAASISELLYFAVHED